MRNPWPLPDTHRERLAGFLAPGVWRVRSKQLKCGRFAVAVRIDVGCILPQNLGLTVNTIDQRSKMEGILGKRKKDEASKAPCQ